MTTNWNILKSFSREELMEMVPEGFTFKTNPWTHQIAAFLGCISNTGFLNALDLGTGKTKVAVDLCRYLDFTNENKCKIKVLYVCLNSAVEKMRDEVTTHSDFSAICLRGNKKEKLNMLKGDFNFYIINYESLRSLLVKKEKREKAVYNEDTGITKIKKFNKQVADQKLIRAFIRDNKFDVLILDESHTIKTHTSLIFRILKIISKQTEQRCLLTGTPFGNTLLDVWPQYYVVDYGETFSHTFTLYRNSYFVDKGWFGPEWKVTPKGEKHIKSLLYSKAIRYKESECEDLPKKVFRVLDYKLDKAQRKAYGDTLDIGHDSITENPKRKAIALKEICSGFIADSDYTFKKNPKLELVWDLIENIHEEHKAVIFVERTASLDIIKRLLKKKKIQFTHMSSATKDKYSENMKFQNDHKYRVMVANIKSGGASIDLTAATYCIFWEHGGSVINYKQALKRIHRGGQTKRCFFYSLVGINTVEVSVYKDLQAGNDAFTNIVDGKQAKAYLLGN